jgi:hypothetical protein
MMVVVMMLVMMVVVTMIHGAHDGDNPTINTAQCRYHSSLQCSFFIQSTLVITDTLGTVSWCP